MNPVNLKVPYSAFGSINRKYDTVHMYILSELFMRGCLAWL